MARPAGLGLRAAVLIPLGALLAWALIGTGFLNYDTAYSLLWGGDVAHLRQPDFSVPVAPTPHPLATVAGRRPDARSATPAQTIWVVLAFLALGALGWVTYELGAHWFGPAAGAVAALVILTRIPVLSFGVRAYVDIPYVALVLGAILAEARRPRHARPAAPARPRRACCAPRRGCSRSPTSPGGATPRLLPLALAAPVLWMLHDLRARGRPAALADRTRATTPRRCSASPASTTCR